MGTGDLAFFIVVLVPFCIWMILLWKNTRKLHRNLKLVAQQHNLIRNDKGARAVPRHPPYQPARHGGTRLYHLPGQGRR